MTSSKWKHFPRYWPFVRGIHRSPWIPLTKASDAELWWFFLICAWTNGWLNNRDADDYRRHRIHYDSTVMKNLIRRDRQWWMLVYEYLRCPRHEHQHPRAGVPYTLHYHPHRNPEGSPYIRQGIPQDIRQGNYFAPQSKHHSGGPLMTSQVVGSHKGRRSHNTWRQQQKRWIWWNLRTGRWGHLSTLLKQKVFPVTALSKQFCGISFWQIKKKKEKHQVV